MTTDLEAFIKEQKHRLGQERKELDDAIAKLMISSESKRQGQRTHLRDPTAISPRDVDADRIAIKSPGRIPGPVSQLDTMNKQQRKKLAVISDEPPKYGLPGMGEYEEKRKQYEDEWKKECRKHFAEEAAKPRRGKGRPETPLDYDVILAQRREEEQRYRQMNGDPYYGGNMKASTSDGYLNRDAESLNDYQDYGVEVRNLQREIDELGGTLDRIKYQGESRSSKNLNEYIDSDDVVDQYNRPHSYPQPYTTGAGYWQADKPESDPGFREHGNGVSDQQRKSYSLPRNGVKNRNANPPRRSSQEEQHRPPSPVFISLTGQHSEVSKAPIDKRLAYQADLAKQMEETRLRKQKEREEQMRYEQRIDEDNSNYNPWGRGGAGAPRKDSQGNLIANRNQAQQGHSLPRFEGNAPIGDTRKIVRYQETKPDQQNFARPLAPEPLVGKKKESKGGTSNYQLELQQQILDKKHREMEEKEKELMEEALWTRRIEEQQEKMKREYNDDLRKQQAREEQLRKRNEELRNIQEQQRQEAQRKLKEGRELSRKEWWEAQQRGHKFQADPEDMVANGNSPPIPAVRKPELPAIGKASEAHHRVATKMNQKPDNSQLAGVYPAARTNILSQLSVMRQQLEQEQKALQEQLQKQKAIATYNVYDRKPPTMPIKNHEKTETEKDQPSVKPETLRRQNTRSIYRPGSPPRNNSNNEDKTGMDKKVNRSVYRPSSPTTKKVPMTQRIPPQQAPKQRKQYETAGDLVRGKFLAGENLGEENAALSTLLRPEELRNSYASLRSLQGDSIFIGVDDEEKIQMERNKPGTVRIGNDSRNHVTNGNDRNRRGYESQESFENEEGTYLERFMIKNLPR